MTNVITAVVEQLAGIMKEFVVGVKARIDRIETAYKADVAAVRDEIAALEARIGTPPAPAESPALTDLSAAVATIGVPAAPAAPVPIPPAPAPLAPMVALPNASATGAAQ
jgi:hypothetical protein